MKDSRRIVRPALWLILSIISASCMEFYVAKIWSAGQPSQFSDLYAPWWGAHELFLHRRNPYTPAVAREIQTVIYGAPVATSYRGDSSELEGGFAYPLYAAFLLWPTVHMPFAIVQTLCICASLAAALASLAMWLRAFHFRAPPVELLTFSLFTLGSFPVLQGIRLQNLSLIAAGLLTLSVVLLTTEHLTLAGVLLAASTFKPQFTVLLVPWLALWAVRDWRRRQSLAWSFLASLLLLIGASEWLLPGWIGGFLAVLRAYRQYTFGRSLLDVWFTPRVGPFAAAGLLLAVFALCWQYRRHGTNSPSFMLVISLLLAATLTVIPTLAPHTQLLLLPGLVCLQRYRSLLWGSKRLARLVLAAVWLLLAWPWVAAAGLTLAAVLLPARAMLRCWELPLYTSPLLPLAVLLALVCLLRTGTWATDQDFSPRSQ
jgi:Glycosyltransferase family 87